MAGGFKDYLGAVWGQALLSWRKGAVIMTALISIILVGGLYAGWQISAYPTWLFVAGTGAITAFDVLVIFPYQLWKTNTAKIIALEHRLAPKVKCSFDANDAGCVKPNTSMIFSENDSEKRIILVTWYRIKVEALGTAQFCTGRVLSVTRAGSELLASETPNLHFAPRDDGHGLQKLVSPGFPEYLDLLATNVTDGARLTLKGPLSPSVFWHDLFSHVGDYIIKVGIIHGMPTPAIITLRFHWTLDPLTSSISVVS